MKKVVVIAIIIAFVGMLCPLANVILNHETPWAGAAYALVSGVFIGIVDLLTFRHSWKNFGFDILWCTCGGVIMAFILWLISIFGVFS